MNEKVVIVGGGESGVGAALLAKAKGFSVFLSDQGNLKDTYKETLIQSGIDFEESNHSFDQILNADWIIKSPGVPEKTEIMKAIRKKGITVSSEIEFASRFTKKPIIAITGTNGKTTTTLLTYHLFKNFGFHTQLVGNIGISFAKAVIDDIADCYVVEVSSFQLDDIQTFKPHIGILLNITPDHLDRYNYDFDAYKKAKFNLTKNMSNSDYVIYFKDDATIYPEFPSQNTVTNYIEISLTESKANGYADSEHIHFQNFFSVKKTDTSLIGKHNQINMLCAGWAALKMGITENSIRSSFKNFKNADHRLEYVGEINGVTYINDSKATNVDAVFYALEGIEKPIIWIAGGIDKGNQYDQIKGLVSNKVKCLICLGIDNSHLKTYFEPFLSIQETQSIDEVIKMSQEMAQNGDVVLLSPACASFDLFKNYEDRGEKFKNAVKNYISQNH